MPKHQQPHYHLQEPATGLYVQLGERRPRLTGRRDSTRFTTADAALTAASAHMPLDAVELVRVDA